MNKLDSIYYEAVTSASESGTVSIDALATLHSNARKFAIIDEPGESARFYERIFSIFRNLHQQSRPLTPELKSAFTAAFAEYIALLEKLGRHERVATVYDAMRLL